MPPVENDPGYDTNADVKIQMRIKAHTRDVIDQAAQALGKNRTEFITETAFREAQNVLLEQRVYYLGEATWDQFIAVLDASPKHNPKLRALLARRPLWEA